MLFFFLLLIVSVVCTPILAEHQGYVLIQTDNYNIETSVTGLVIMFLLLLIMLIGTELMLRCIFYTTTRTRGWFIGRKRTLARSQTKAALIKLVEGEYKQAESLLTSNADHAEQPMVNYLLAAEAAQTQGDAFRSNQYLERAAKVADTDQFPVNITRVRIQLAKGEVHAACHGINLLLENVPHHPEVLRLAENAYLRTGAYSRLLEILPSMKKIGLHSENKLHALEQVVYIGLINQFMGAEKDSDALKRWWKDQSSKTRDEVPLQIAMVENLIEYNDYDMAREIVVNSLKREYDERLVFLIPRLKFDNWEYVERLLHYHIAKYGTTPLINSTLGQVLIQNGEWEQAANAFREALKKRQDVYDYARLGDALEKLHRLDEAVHMWRQGLMLKINQQQKNKL